MRTLVVGATGLIGSAVVARLSQAGHVVVAAVRRSGPEAARLAANEHVCIDLRSATDSDAWLPLLRGVEAVVNCAGVLQDGARDATQAIHYDAAKALFEACVCAGVRRVVQISAIGIDRDTPTAFSRTKLAGDRFLTGLDLDWVILRPSVVVGRAAYGGSALFRALAAVPVLPVVSGTGLLQVVQLDDVARTVAFFVCSKAPARVTLELAGPERLSFESVVAAYRRWLGWKVARHISLPNQLARAIFVFGDVLGWLGWRPPVRTTALMEIRRGAVGDPEAWTRATGIEPQSLALALAAEPASVQERWFARLCLLKPLVLGMLALFWIVTGVVSISSGFHAAVALTRKAGYGSLTEAIVISGALADIVIGLAMAFRRTARAALCAAAMLTLFYIVAATALAPEIWADPLGPLVKTFPVLGLILVGLAVLDDR